MGDEQEMYGKDSGSLKSYKTMLSPIREATSITKKATIYKKFN
jgi:hypothetical protein